MKVMTDRCRICLSKVHLVSRGPSMLYWAHRVEWCLVAHYDSSECVYYGELIGPQVIYGASE